MKQLLGGLLLAAPFIAIFILGASLLGVWGAVSVFMAAAALCASIILGAWLVNS